MAKNMICHVEIPVADAENAGEFYKKLFGWQLNFDMGNDYVFFQPETEPGGALSKTENHSPSKGILLYIQVDDIDTYLEKAVELGGRELKGKTDIPGHGWYAHFADPDGNVVGLYTALPKE